MSAQPTISGVSPNPVKQGQTVDVHITGSGYQSPFVHAIHVTSAISSAVALLGALVVLRWMPGKGSGDALEASAEPRESVEV